MLPMLQISFMTRFFPTSKSQLQDDRLTKSLQATLMGASLSTMSQCTEADKVTFGRHSFTMFHIIPFPVKSILKAIRQLVTQELEIYDTNPECTGQKEIGRAHV